MRRIMCFCRHLVRLLPVYLRHYKQLGTIPSPQLLMDIAGEL